jgi:hypothetical protein
MTEFDWHEEPVPAGFPIRQVHGWLADETGRFLLQDRVHEEKFLLPGGKCDSTDEGWIATLVRECDLGDAGRPVAGLGLGRRTAGTRCGPGRAPPWPGDGPAPG